MIFKSLEHNPLRMPSHAVVDLEGGEDEVLHIRAFGKDVGIEIMVDDTQTGVVIVTTSGLYRWPLKVA